jgi:hypothetical protein
LWFLRRMRQTERPRQPRLLGVVLAFDTIVFVIGGATLTVPLVPTVGLAATPLAVIVAVVQPVTFAVARLRRWGVPDGHRPSLYC